MAGWAVQFFARYFFWSAPVFTTVQPERALNVVHHRRGPVPVRTRTSTLTWSALRSYGWIAVPLQTAFWSLPPLIRTISQVAPVSRQAPGLSSKWLAA